METTGAIEGSYRLPSFENARAGDAMHPGVVSCTPETSLRTVAQIMAERHIHSVVVTDVSREASRWGVVSDVDILRAASLPTVTVDEELARAAQVMAEHEVTHLIVVDAANASAVGVLSSLDIAGILAWGRA
jgi:CBS domain-containing protein